MKTLRKENRDRFSSESHGARQWGDPRSGDGMFWLMAKTENIIAITVIIT